MLDYICPKCKKKVSVEEGNRLPSVFCRNCMRSRQLIMLRMIRPHIPKSDTIKI